MAVTANCTHAYTDASGKQKKCGVIEPFLDPKTDKAYCPNCNSEIPNVSFFIKTTLKTLKQYKPKVAVPFAVKCESCGKEAQPKIVNGNLLCPNCNNEHEHLSESHKIMLKLMLKTVNKEV